MEVSSESNEDNKNQADYEVDIQLVCDQCENEDQDSLATGYCMDCQEHLCKVCYEYHFRAKMFRKHTLLDAESMPTTKSVPLKTINTENKCLKHKDEIIKYYCTNDWQFGCGSCMLKKHKQCDLEKITDIEEEYIKFNAEIKKLFQQIDHQSKTKEQNNEKNDTNNNEAVKNIKLFMKDIMEFYEKLEDEMLRTADELKDFNDAMLDSISKKCETLRAHLHSMTTKLDKLSQTQQNKKLFTSMEEERNKIAEISNDIQQMNIDNKIEQYTFIPEKEILATMKIIKSLGKLENGNKD